MLFRYALFFALGFLSGVITVFAVFLILAVNWLDQLGGG